MRPATARCVASTAPNEIAWDVQIHSGCFIALGVPRPRKRPQGRAPKVPDHVNTIKFENRLSCEMFHFGYA
jgi:hypothetical protein